MTEESDTKADYTAEELREMSHLDVKEFLDGLRSQIYILKAENEVTEGISKDRHETIQAQQDGLLSLGEQLASSSLLMSEAAHQVVQMQTEITGLLIGIERRQHQVDALRFEVAELRGESTED